MTKKDSTCPYCGCEGLRGPYNAPDGQYFECDACYTHVPADAVEWAELKDAYRNRVAHWPYEIPSR